MLKSDLAFAACCAEIGFNPGLASRLHRSSAYLERRAALASAPDASGAADWQKVRSHVRPPSKDRPRKSRRFHQIAQRERRQADHLLHIVTSHFIRECVKRGVGEIAIGDPTGIRDGIDYGARVNYPRLKSGVVDSLEDAPE
jgi:hypothetical protein